MDSTVSTASPAGVVSRTGKRIIRVDPAAKPTHKPKPPLGKAPNGKKKPPRKPAQKKPLVSPSDLKARELNDRLNGFPGVTQLPAVGYRLDGTEEGEINGYQRQLATDTLAARLQAKA